MFELLENNSIISDYIVNLLNEFKKEENKDYTIIWDILSKIFNVNGVYELLLKLYNNSRTD